ncbi:MAG: hypothetical protein HYY61_06155 [Deltaproteobacteria bacterium]|nr:hypothetical protein [Deltaproteobacteria bacterium]
MDNTPDLPIFVKWIDFLKWLLKTTEKFPKKVRFTFKKKHCIDFEEAQKIWESKIRVETEALTMDGTKYEKRYKEQT